MSKKLPVYVIGSLVLLVMAIYFFMSGGYKFSLLSQFGLTKPGADGTISSSNFQRLQSTDLEIALISDHPEYNIRFTDKEKVMNYLDQINFWAANPDTSDIRIFLTTDPQDFKQEFDKQNSTPDNPRYSIGYQASQPGILDVYIQLGNSLFSEKYLNIIATKIFLYSLYLKSTTYDQIKDQGYSYNLFSDNWLNFNNGKEIFILEIFQKTN
jgi:hypothetical protein